MRKEAATEIMTMRKKAAGALKKNPEATLAKSFFGAFESAAEKAKKEGKDFAAARLAKDNPLGAMKDEALKRKEQGEEFLKKKKVRLRAFPGYYSIRVAMVWTSPSS